MKPDIVIEVRFKTTEEGGRSCAVGGTGGTVDYYGCSLIVSGEALECRLLLENRRFELGQTHEVPVKLLNPLSALPKLASGTPLILWEGKDVGTGRVLRVLSKG